MRATEIRKGKNTIEDILGSYSALPPETERLLETLGQSKYRGLLGRYAIAVDLGMFTKPDISSRILHEQYNVKVPDTETPFLRHLLPDVLSPEEINAVLQMTMFMEDHNYYDEWTGRAVSVLIQNSYDAGHNDFHINTESLKDIGFLALRLKGTEERPLTLTITGDSGNLFAWGSEYLTAIINGNAGKSNGGYAKHSTLNINGNAGNGCAYRAKESRFNITGDVGEHCGMGAGQSTFSTPNKATLQKLVKEIRPGNRVIYIHEGRDITVRDYADKN